MRRSTPACWNTRQLSGTKPRSDAGGCGEITYSNQSEQFRTTGGSIDQSYRRDVGQKEPRAA